MRNIEKLITAIAMVTCAFSATIAIFAMTFGDDPKVWGITFGVSAFYLCVRGLYEILRWI